MVGARRGAIDEACQSYCSEAFADGAVCAVYPDGAGVTICISSRIYAPSKAWYIHTACALALSSLMNGCCRSGRWQSQYSVADGKLSGQISVSIHYYEYGNTVKTAQHTVGPVSARPAVASRNSAVCSRSLSLLMLVKS